MASNFRRYNSYSGTTGGYRSTLAPPSYNSYSSGSSSIGGRSFGYGSVGSDTSSVRSFGSSRGYGSASIGSLKSTFEPSATSGRYGASSYDPGGGGGGAYRSSSAARRPSMDRSLSYASLNAGAVSSVKSKFDPKPSSAPSREGYSSVDRFSGHSSGDYVTRSGGGGGGYGSDLDVGSMRSYSSYGRSPSSSRGYYGRDYSARESSREPSPTRHGSRLSRTDYEHATLMRSSYGGRDYTTGIDKSYDSGKSYGSGSKYGGGGYSFGTSYVPDYKSKSSVLTPFEPRRQTVTKTAEPSLTPFGKRFGRSISQLEAHSPRSYERQNSERSIKSPERPALLSPRSVPKDDTVQKDTEQRKKRWIPDEELSSDSCEEPTDYRRRNPNVIYMTNRATSPMEIDREGLLDEISKYQRQRRKRLISRTKTKEYARKNYKRRRDKPNICDVCFQVDTEEMDRLSGRVRYIRNKFRDKLQENRNNSYSYGNSQSRPSSGYSSYVPKPDKVARSPSSDQTKDKHSGVPEPDSQRRNRQQGPLSPKQTEPLPKQSAFRKLDRPKRQNEERVDFYQSDVLTDLETHQGSQWEEDDDDDIPQQTSFLDRKRQSEEQPGTTEEVAPLTPENLSLKETIDKVKCWKKQLQQTPPESPIPPAQKESLSPRDRRASKPPKGPSKTPYKYKEQDEDNEYFSDECVEDFANRPKPPIPYQRGQPSRSNSYQSKKDSQPSYHDESSVYDYDTSNSAYGIVSAPKIFIYESDPPYYSNKNLHHLAPADSMASLGDESSMVSDDEPIINRTQSMASLGTFPRRGRNNRAMSMDSLNRFDKSTSVTSLPDLIENKQRSGPYISHSIKDIDSFLDFDETEDDPDLWSDDEVEQMRKNKENYNKAMTRLSSPEEMEEESIPELEIETEAKQIANKRKACLPSWMKVILPRRKKAEKKDKYISDVTNIDDYFDPDINENVGKFNRSESLDARSPLHLDIPTSPGTENFGSCGSILDTPVPETPDVPLAPKPVFGFPKTVEESKPNSQSLDNLEALDPDGKLSLKRLAKKEKNLDKTRSVGNLDDLDSILNTLSSTPPSRRKKRMRDESSTFNLFCKDAKEDLIKEADDNLVSPEHSTRPELITQKSEDILVDVSDVTDQAVASNLVRNEDGTYPADYSAEAVRQAILLELVKGTISTAELLDFCKLELPKKPPWVVADEDRCFAGFSNMDGLLEAFGVDVKKLEDCALQLYKYNNGQGDYGTYLDLESSLEEQYDDIEGFSDCKKNAIILRTLLSVRVHACIEKLLISTGRELRRALFSLKQIFQDDKDLVHEFVNNDGLECLIKVGSEADQNYQNYILRALGQVMLYVDGMNGVIAHNETVQWLYSLTASKFRLVVKTALKLLLVFVDYTEPNTLLLLQAINTVDRARGEHPWCNIMNILNEKDGGDTELLVYAMTLISKALNAVADQDTFYDVTDVLEEQGMEHIIRRHMTRQNADLDLLEQFQVYEAVLRAEDGLDNGEGGHTDSLRKMKRKQSENESRKSRRYSAENSNNAERMRHTPSPLPPTLEVSEPRNSEPTDAAGTAPTSICSQPLRRRERPEYSDEPEPPWWRAGSTGGDSGGSTTPQALSPRQQMNGHSPQQSTASPEAPYEKAGRRRRQPRSGAESTQHAHQASSESGELEGGVLPPANISNNRRWLLYKQKKSQEGLEVPGAEEEGEGAGHQKRLSADGGESLASRLDSLHQQQERDAENHGAGSRGAVPSELTNSVQAAQEKLRGTAELNSNASKEAKQDLGFSGLISKAKDGLSSSSTRAFERPKAAPEPVVVKKTDSELQWEEIEKSLERELKIQGYDFSDLTKADEINLLEVPQHTALGGGPPPPPPLGYGFGAVPPPPPAFPGAPPPPPPVPVVPAPPPPPGGLVPPPPSLSGSASDLNTLGKNKKTVKLHWKEATTEFQLPSGRQMDTIWKRMNREYHLIKIDTEKLEHLFETRTSEVKQKAQKQEGAKKEIIVLDPRRSNAINIGLTVLPPKGTIKTAILKMDTSILNRECIEKILTIMLPTEEEKNKILECQMANPGVPLGNAEQFLLSLSTISELEARLRLWAFKLDYDGCESEVAEPLNDLKQGMEDLRNNKTFKFILALLLSIGNFLNGAQAKGFTVEYLARVPEVKDTVHKHSLLHHLCNMVVDQCPGSTDLYSELGAVARCSKVDFDELADKLAKMEADCKASWDHLRSIAKHDVTYNMRNKLPEFLTDSAERIILLKIIHKRILNRFYKFMLFLGYPVNLAKDVKVHAFCKVVTEFALEYKTTRDKVLQMREKKANARERKKTRGKMIVETENFSGVSSSPRPADPEKNEDDKLKRLLHNGYASQDDGSSSRLPGTHVRKRYSLDKGQQPRRMGLGSGRAKGSDSESVYDTADDDVLDSVLRSAVTSGAPARTRQRTRARNKDRKSLRRTLKNGLSKEDIEALNETYSKTAQSGAT